MTSAESSASAQGASKEQKKPEPLDESKINAPSMQDLIVLGVICIATLVLWAAGRAACNYHVPGESLTPRKVTLEERTRTHKHVGIEFAQALSGGDFDTARKLAKGEALQFVARDEKKCGSCGDREDRADEVLSVGTVLQANSVDAIVKVRTLKGVGGETTRFFGIEREGRDWRVTRVYQSEAEAELKEAPARDDAPSSIRRPEDDEETSDSGAEEATEGDEGNESGPADSATEASEADESDEEPGAD